MGWWRRAFATSRSEGDAFGHPQFAVARFLLREAMDRSFTVTHMKLQKMVYLAHAWMLALHGIPLVQGRLEAWRYGPVFPQLYHALKAKGAEPLTLADVPECDATFDEDETNLMVWAVERYGPLSAARLSRLTHAQSSPWEFTRRQGRNREIPAESIRGYYRLLLTPTSAEQSSASRAGSA